MSIQPLWLTYFIEILLVLEFQLTKTYFGTFSYKAHFRHQISSNDYVVFIFNLQSSSSLIIWLLRSTTSLTLWPFDQQHHLQHFNLSISNIIFSSLTFRSATSSTLWPFDQQHHLQHFDLSISNIISTLTFQSITSSTLWPCDQ